MASTDEVRIAAATEALAQEVQALLERTSMRASVFVSGEARAFGVDPASASDRAPLIAVVEGKAAAVAALSAGVDEVVEERVLGADTLVLAIRLATQRAEHRASRHELERALERQERLATLGTVVAGVAHEINNPAMAIALNINMLGEFVRATHESLSEMLEMLGQRHRVPREQLRGHIDAALARFETSEADVLVRDTNDSIRAIVDLVRDLRVSSRSVEDAPPEVVDVRRLVKQVLRLVGTDPNEGMHIEVDLADDLPLLWLPRTRLMQILTNLVANARHAMESVRRPLHRLRVVARTDETAVMIAVSDTGVGIPTRLLEQVFQPYFTTKSAEKGTGLGLHMSREVVRKLGGDLTMDSIEGEGTTVLVFLPLALQTVTRPTRPESENKPRAASRVLLLSEDLMALRQLNAKLRARFDVVLARDALEALRLLEGGTRVDAIAWAEPLVLMDAETLDATIRARWPHLTARCIRLRKRDLRSEDVAELFRRISAVAEADARVSP